MAERARHAPPTRESGAVEKYQPAPGIPQIVIDCFADGHTYGTIRDLSKRHAAAFQEYYGLEYLGDGKWGPNISLDDIKKEPKRQIFHMLLRSGLLKITQHLPADVKAKYFQDPDDNTWFLKEIDNPSTESKWTRYPALGIPLLAHSVLSLSKRKGLLDQLDDDELAVLEKYYARARLEKGFSPNFSLEVDIDDEKEREAYKEALAHIMNDLLKQLPKYLVEGQPAEDDVTWFLKKVDTNPQSLIAKRLWKTSSKLRAVHSQPKSDAHKEKIGEGVSRVPNRAEHIRDAMIKVYKDHPETKQQVLVNLAKANEAKKAIREAQQSQDAS